MNESTKPFSTVSLLQRDKPQFIREPRPSLVLKAFPGSHRNPADKDSELILNPKYNIRLKA
jgi:hypothetical protein